MRRLVPAAVAAVLLVPLTTPADAATAVLVLTCNFHYDPSRSLDGDCTVTGIPASGGAHFEAMWSPGGGGCAIADTSSGTFTGSGGLAGFSVDFNLTRVSTVGVITVSGGTNGTGTAVFSNVCAGQSAFAVLTIAGI